MKKTILICIFSIYTCFLMQGQVMHSSNNLEISFGLAGFSTFEPRVSEFDNFGFSGSFFGQEPVEGYLRWNPVMSINYRKVQSTGNYFGFSGTYGKNEWLENDIEVTTFDTFGQPSSINFSEQRKEGTIGLAYTYSFLINKNSPNLQFFIGAHGSIYDNFAENNPIESEGGNTVNRNILGMRISTVPELMYLFPNSRVTVSFRTILPLLHAERDQQTQRAFASSSSFFFGFGSTVHNSFDFLAIGRTRFELGIGYFLEAQ